MWLLLSAIYISELPGAWGLSETEAGLTATIMMCGFLIGAYIWGYTSDKYGRLFSFRKTLLISGLAAVGATCSVDLPMLLVFCFIAGIGIGGDVPVDGSVFIEF
jgi:MFS family permease